MAAPIRRVPARDVPPDRMTRGMPIDKLYPIDASAVPMMLNAGRGEIVKGDGIYY